MNEWMNEWMNAILWVSWWCIVLGTPFPGNLRNAWPTDRWTDGPTDRQTKPLIENRKKSLLLCLLTSKTDLCVLHGLWCGAKLVKCIKSTTSNSILWYTTKNFDEKKILMKKDFDEKKIFMKKDFDEKNFDEKKLMKWNFDEKKFWWNEILMKKNFW